MKFITELNNEFSGNVELLSRNLVSSSQETDSAETETANETETYECGCPVHECPTEEQTTAELLEVETYTPGGNNIDHMLETLPLMGKGMLGIFLVTAVIILSVAILNKTTGGKKKKDE